LGQKTGFIPWVEMVTKSARALTTRMGDEKREKVVPSGGVAQYVEAPR